MMKACESGAAHATPATALAAAYAALSAAKLAASDALVRYLLDEYRRATATRQIEGGAGPACDAPSLSPDSPLTPPSAARPGSSAPIDSTDALPAELPCGVEELLAVIPKPSWSQLAALCDVTVYRAHSLARQALIQTYGMPKTRAKVVNEGGVGFERLEVAARAAQKVPEEYQCYLDETAASVDAGEEFTHFRKTVEDATSLLRCVEHSVETAHRERKVAQWNNGDGTACLLLTGPVHTVTACHRRLEGFARAIARAQNSAFGTQLPAGRTIDDDRTLAQLMFDILINQAPALPVATTSSAANEDAAGNDGAAISAKAGFTGSGPVESDAPATQGTQDFAEAGRDTGSGAAGSGNGSQSAESADASACRRTSAFHDAGSTPSRQGCGHLEAAPFPEEIEAAAMVTLRMPTHTDWLKRQTTVVLTVPALTAFGEGALPGMLDDQSPVPADMARLIAAHAPTFDRILTDPVSGAVLETAAQNYAIPSALRTTVLHRWLWCTAPGCTRKATRSEVDHIIPFDHDAPADGGRTVIENLHPLCKHHHQLKTEGKIRVRRTPEGDIEWTYPSAIATTVRPPSSAVDVEHARAFVALTEAHDSLVPDEALLDPSEDPPHDTATGSSPTGSLSAPAGFPLGDAVGRVRGRLTPETRELIERLRSAALIPPRPQRQTYYPTSPVRPAADAPETSPTSAAETPAGPTGHQEGGPSARVAATAERSGIATPADIAATSDTTTQSDTAPRPKGAALPENSAHTDEAPPLDMATRRGTPPHSTPATHARTDRGPDHPCPPGIEHAPGTDALTRTGITPRSGGTPGSDSRSTSHSQVAKSTAPGTTGEGTDAGNTPRPQHDGSGTYRAVRAPEARGGESCAPQRPPSVEPPARAPGSHGPRSGAATWESDDPPPF